MPCRGHLGVGHHRAETLIQVRQPRLGVPNKANIQRIVLAQLPGIFVQMDQPYVAGYGTRRIAVDVQPQEVHAHHQHGVEAGQPGPDVRRPEGQALGVEWMVTGHCETAVR